MAKTAQPRRAMTLGTGAMATVIVHPDETVKLTEAFSVSVNQLHITGAPDLEACNAVATSLRVLERGSPFALGDFLNYVEQRFGEQASQIVDATEGWNRQTIGVYQWVAARIAPAHRRMDRLGIRHHLLVATLAPLLQIEWLTKAAADEAEEPWTVARLAAALKAGEDVAPTAWFVVVACETVAQQNEVLALLQGRGLTAKATTGRKKLAAREA